METFAALTLLTLHVFLFILVYIKDRRHQQATKEEKGGARKLKEHGKKMWKSCKQEETGKRGALDGHTRPVVWHVTCLFRTSRVQVLTRRVITTTGVRGFPKSFLMYVGIVRHVRSWPSYFIFILIHYSPFIIIWMLQNGIYWSAFWNKS